MSSRPLLEQVQEPVLVQLEHAELVELPLELEGFALVRRRLLEKLFDPRAVGPANSWLRKGGCPR